LTQKRTTIQDIAKRSGVTKATVSMVMNNDTRITEATRKKVMEAVKALHYVPNESARKLAKGKSEVLAVLSPRFTAPYTSSFLEGIEMRALEVSKYVHGVHPYTTRNQPAVLEDEMRRILYGRKADAVMLVTQTPPEEIVQEYLRMNLPLILVENTLDPTHSVRYDNEAGARRAVEHLLERGRKRIAMIVGKQTPYEGYGSYQPPVERTAGYRKALEAHGIPFEDALVREVIHYVYEDGQEAMRHFLSSPKPPDAVFCAAGDIVAMGVMEEVRRQGKSVPKDVAVVGFDDILPARFLNPPLTSVRQSAYELGVQAFDIAMDAIEGKLKEKRHVVLDQELVVREST